MPELIIRHIREDPALTYDYLRCEVQRYYHNLIRF